MILGPVVADASGAHVGQVITLDMAAGPVRTRVIGIDTGQNNSGNIVYFPLPALERLDGTPGTANSLWVTTASPAHSAVDQAASAVASPAPAAGYPVTTTRIYAYRSRSPPPRTPSSPSSRSWAWSWSPSCSWAWPAP